MHLTLIYLSSYIRGIYFVRDESRSGGKRSIGSRAREFTKKKEKISPPSLGTHFSESRFCQLKLLAVKKQTGKRKHARPASSVEHAREFVARPRAANLLERLNSFVREDKGKRNF